jgi:hypothetical protein
MKVFWSWQNDYEPESNRHFIRSALDEAVKQAGEELGLEPAERPELDHDTKNTPGMADITNTILKKINESAVFVADLTPIGETNGGKALPNPNVMIELGWALKSLGPDRIIAVMNIHSGYTLKACTHRSSRSAEHYRTKAFSLLAGDHIRSSAEASISDDEWGEYFEVIETLGTS